MKLSAARKATFQKTVFEFYAKNKRNSLPWRPTLPRSGATRGKTINPYMIWISEVMLQQTQVDRVVPFFNRWMKSFPTIKSLASAPQSEVLRHWKGLGYNSRALRLKRAAQKIVEDYGGKFPRDFESILKLPGIGPYTAGAITAFAYNERVVMIETNIRRVFIWYFWQNSKKQDTSTKIQTKINDKDILELVAQTLPKDNFREWYWALMDYGSHLGRISKDNPNKRSRHYTKQSKFAGSDRQIRGRILEILLKQKKMGIEAFQKALEDLSNDLERIENILSGLEREGFIVIRNGTVRLK